MSNPSLTAGFDLPFKEQIDFFRAKLNLPTDKWDDIWQGAHDRAFVVAGATKADLLNDLRQAVDKAISTGTSLETFRKDFRAIVAKHGWQGWTGEGTPGGFSWRTRVIYETNLRSSYAAGRWAQLNDPAFKTLMPFWRYVHADSVLNPRPLHKRWGDMRLTLPSDHPFWKTHFPPNGWGCRCRVTAVTKAKDGDATEPPEGWDRINETTGAPPGIDRGWGYAPGASLRGELKNVIDTKAKALPPPLAKALVDSTTKVLNKVPFEVAKTAKEAAAFAVRADLADFADYGSIKPEVANAWNRSLYDHLTEFPELRKNQRFVGTAQAQFARWREIEIGRYIAKLKAANPHLPDTYDFRPMAEKRIKPIRVAGNTYAHSWAQVDVAGVAVNQKFGKDPATFLRSLAADVQSKFHPPGCDSIRSVVDHELAHQLDGLLKIHLDADAIRIYNEARSKGLKDEVSVYAGSNIREFIAECWAESCNNPTPREFARLIAALIRQRYADQFP